ncbi:TetR/AcrR family transcriptional regulator [Cystobacter fuscus]|uniref:TetR/AcrR family transcriptional regulator n=1 Tax=Cystobacter fuscus TaxID=43 RepID=UPI002B324A11|nr:helix-turn-helix transcriptional regulator [Cystobacter fuscus]
MARPADPHARAALIAAARVEFMKKGLKGARIEDITAACGLSKGAFYLHAASKEALFGEVLSEFMSALQGLIDQRREETERFFAEQGAVEARDVSERSARYERLLAMSAEGDLRTLELMWAYRDVMQVLMRGSQGTDFESLMWGFVDREVSRVAQEFRRLQSGRALRSDVPSEVIGSLIVGTYVLLAQRMSQMQEKPDLAAWANSIHLLIREGCVPRCDVAAPVEPPRAPPPETSTSSRRASSRALSRTRSTPRSGS